MYNPFQPEIFSTHFLAAYNFLPQRIPSFGKIKPLKKPKKEQETMVEIIAHITCPECGYTKKEEMPDNY